ncbi:MAG: hypothetical protein IIX81_04060 [Tidjanibacter sp.]|nr:hypothetical protein [Tidjanibacter sp.]
MAKIVKELRIEANASKRGQRLLADYAEREHFRATEGWSIENFGAPSVRVFINFCVVDTPQFSTFNFPFSI